MWINMLGLWQWAALAGVLAAIVSLYFLKLKRQPLEVPSTYLWHKSIEDLHVNSIWQRLRQSLLLFLQLLLLLLACLAVLRPGWHGSKLLDHRFIFLVDNSASMSAVDVEPTRLAEAKRRIAELIDQMDTGDVAMIVSFADGARVEQTFTDNRRELHRKLEAIRQTNQSTSLDEALRAAAGLANPGKATFEISDTEVATSSPATMYIFSDGKFPGVEGFSLGALKPIYVPIGDAKAENIGITAFSTQRPDGNPDKLQAYARLENFTAKDVIADADLSLDGTIIDANKVAIPAGKSAGVVFELSDIHSGALKLQLKSGGDLKVDDAAWTAINPPQRSRVLFASPGNEALRLALGTTSAEEIAEVTVVGPEFLDGPEYKQKAGGAGYDLVIFDQCRPNEMPQANTLFIGSMPPGSAWSLRDEKIVAPQVIDVNTSHPLMQLVDLGNVRFAEGRTLNPPPGSTTLIQSHKGILFAVGPREGFEDAVLGTEIVGSDENGERMVNTDWPLRLSFPVWVLNTLQYLGNRHESAAGGDVRPGKPVVLRSLAPTEQLSLRTPSGRTVKVPRGKQNTFNFTGTDDVGIYEVEENQKVTQRFAVNLFDSAESNIQPRPENSIKIGYVDVKGQTHWEGARQEIWRPLLLAALGVLLFEWYIYNRRVYL